jgi:hypothetical protein
MPVLIRAMTDLDADRVRRSVSLGQYVGGLMSIRAA